MMIEKIAVKKLSGWALVESDESSVFLTLIAQGQLCKFFAVKNEETNNSTLILGNIAYDMGEFDEEAYLPTMEEVLHYFAMKNIIKKAYSVSFDFKPDFYIKRSRICDVCNVVKLNYPATTCSCCLQAIISQMFKKSTQTT